MSIKLFGKNREKIDYENVNGDLINRIAKSLLLKHVIVVNDVEYRICEIEFYIKSKNHNDSYTHCDPIQRMFGKWYFHRYGNGSYKNGTYKGMDLTLGSNNTYLGVLIRSIYNSDTDEITEGPCRVVNKILEHYGSSNVADYMQDKENPLYARTKGNFYIKRDVRLQKYTVYCGPRIGLSDKYPEFRMKNYRFVIMKDRIKKEKSKLMISA